MSKPFKLKSLIGESYSMAAEDTLNAKKPLATHGHMETPEYGLDEYPDRPMIDAVKSFQRESDLVEDGAYLLKLAVLGGKRLQESEYSDFIRLVEPDEVIYLVPALKVIDEDNLRARYFKHCKGAWPEYGEEDFEYTWEYFEMLRDFLNGWPAIAAP
ncbi:MAG: DUF1877 family protein [Rhodospirillales bacterium]